MATHTFLKLTKNGQPIKGECQDAPFQGLIQLHSFQMASLSLLTLPGARPGRAGEPAPEAEAPGEDACAFTVKKRLDSSSADLFINYAQAQNPATKSPQMLSATVYFRLDGPQPKVQTPESVSFLQLDFFNVFVYAYSLEGDHEKARPEEEVKLYFDKYQMTYKDPYLSTGMKLKPPTCIGWDFSTGESA